jgi:hypothetical protein
VHGQRQRDPRPGAAVPTALMWQASAPDHEIARPRRDLDGVMAGKINRDVEHGTGMGVQVLIELAED